jgi:hypothetical protein
MRAAVDPAMTTGWGAELAAGHRVGAFLKSLRGRSAAAELFERGMRFDMSGISTVGLPALATDYPAPGWIGEGQPIPAQKGNLGSVTLGPPKKLAAIAGLTGELADLATEDAEAVIDDLMRDAAARALDASIFSATAASAVRPAGLLAGVADSGATAGGGLVAFAGDIKKLVAAIHTAGGGGNVVIFAAPEQAAMATIYGGAAFKIPIITAPSLAAGTVIAVEASAFASGFTDAPRVDVGKDALVTWDDAVTAHVGTAGSPNVVAAPTISGFQEYIYALKLVLRAAWAMRATGMVQFITGATY